MTHPAPQLTLMPPPAPLPPLSSMEDLSAEMGVLGRLLSRGSDYEQAAHLVVSDFSQRVHQLIWHAMQRVVQDGGKINYTSVEGQLTQATFDRGEDKGRHPIDVVRAEYLRSLLDHKHTDLEAGVKRIAHMSMIRKGLQTLDKMHRTLMDTQPTLEVRTDQMLKLVTDYALQVQSLGGRRVVTMVDALADHEALVDERMRAHSSGETSLFGVTSAFRGLQALLNGYKRGKVYLLGARPGRGKSAFALNEALNAMKQGVKVVFITLEMGIPELMDRLTAVESGVSSQDIESGNIAPDDLRRLREARQRLAGYESAKTFVYLDFPAQPTISQVERRLSEHMALVGADIVFVDQISDEMLSPEHPRDTFVEKISKASARLKAWATTFNVPVVALGQLNRDTAKNTNGVPTPENFSSSSSLEKTADVTLALYLPEEANTDDDIYPVNAVVLKHRGGRTGTAQLTFVARLTRFEDAR